jgi:hypothetical protein
MVCCQGRWGIFKEETRLLSLTDSGITGRLLKIGD